MPVLANTDKCTGCCSCLNACTKNAIRMREDHEGFLMPEVVSSKCIECGTCVKACPVISDVPNDNEETDTFPKVYALWSYSDREKSSSGGAFSALARWTFEKGGVVFGAVLDDDFNCHHNVAESIDELEPLRGSKYIQSYIDDCYKKAKDYLRRGRYVLFTGTPCQIAGLKCFLKKSYDKLIAVDLVCHGVPSNAVFKAYLDKLRKRGSTFNKTKRIQFRRLNGWGIETSIDLQGKRKIVLGLDNLYMEAFLKNAFFRKSCYQCSYARIPRIGDITIADFWGIGKHGKKFQHHINKGVSLVLANNLFGNRIVEQLKNCFVEERDMNEATEENPNVYMSTDSNVIRGDVINAFINSDSSLLEIEKKFHLIDKSFKGKVKRFAIRTGLFSIIKFVLNK